MNYYAHTATRPDGSPDPDPSKWQPLAEHLRQSFRLGAARAPEEAEVYEIAARRSRSAY